MFASLMSLTASLVTTSRMLQYCFNVMCILIFTNRRAAKPPKVPYSISLFDQNFLSFQMNLVVVMNCGAGNMLYGFDISMFYLFDIKLHFIYISEDSLLRRAQNAKQSKWYFLRKPLCQGLRKRKFGESTILLGCTAVYHIRHDFYRFCWGRGNAKGSLQKRTWYTWLQNLSFWMSKLSP